MKLNITKQLSEIHQSGVSYIIYKSQKGFDLYTDFSKKIILNNKNIKSFLIGVLTAVNLFLLMGFDDHEDEVQKNGRYQVIIDNEGQKNWYDTRYGDKVAMELGSYGYILLKEKGGAKATFKKEFELVEALKKID